MAVVEKVMRNNLPKPAFWRFPGLRQESRTILQHFRTLHMMT